MTTCPAKRQRIRPVTAQRLRASLEILAAACVAALGCVCAAGATVAANRNVSEAARIRAAEAWTFPQRNSPDPSVPHVTTPKPDPREVLHVPGSTMSYTHAQLDNGPPDWFPSDHPVAPRIVAEGHKRASRCAECHLMTGVGVPATAALGGLPKAYVLEQVAAFRTGERGADALASVQSMTREARNLENSDLQLAADYFSQLKFVSRMRVIETATVPKTHWHFYVRVPNQNGEREPIGERIIETPIDPRLYDLEDARDGYIAYVPPGSVERGAVIAAQGIGAAQPCESCHGAKLQGVGIIPPLAGRSPTYIARELILFREGRRANPEAAPMREEVSHLTLKDMIDVAAYAASRTGSKSNAVARLR